MKQISRRTALKNAAGWGALSALPLESLILSQDAELPHFLIQFFFDGGWDTTYLFDARPLSFTYANKVQNYHGTDPLSWDGSNGQTTLASPIVSPLIPFKEDFSVLNGVHMAIGFDGHEQNKNALITCNPFGGNAYFPFINEAATTPAPLDFLKIGGFYGLEISNAMASVNLNADGLADFSKTVKTFDANLENAPDMQFATRRIAHLASGSGLLSHGASLMASGIQQSRFLFHRLRNADPRFEDGDSEIIKSLKATHQYFKHGLTKSAFIDVSTDNLDTHGSREASEQPAIYAKVVASIAEIFGFLKSTPYQDNGQLSLLDVTTVIIGSEFGRTTRQMGKPINDTGTDHNPLANTVLIGGKGVIGGYVIGATDLDTIEPNGDYRDVTGAHRIMDPLLIKAMGKPFNFNTMSPSLDNPESYTGEHYITIASVLNTVLRIFNVSTQKYWPNQRNGPSARVLQGLLRSR